MTTRPATLADLDRIAPLFDAYRQFYEQPADLATATQFLRDRLTRGESQILLAEDGAGQAIGFCQLYPVFCSIAAQPIYLLSDLFVTSAARRSGAGRALLLAAERLSAEHGKLRMELTTARTNHTAQAAYAALGWARDEVYIAYAKPVRALYKL
ncbi:GNAT family N-acetyltransferase [Sphaerotilus sp.]|uniref:GNAT family N-acetyltransferase n=1 Tax=Sphaerotilus sp. TaxID=2093942 RepID=UPI0025D7CC0B|nr:GNAT family N-acetyltransferase [Sphaerotilus sp.]